MMREELLTPEIIKMTKSLKRAIVEITPHFICGSDSLMNTFSIIFLNGNVQVDDDLYYFGPTNLLTKYDTYQQSKHMFESLQSRMNYLRYTVQQVVDNNKLLFAFDDITNFDYINGFTESINAKAKDGARFVYPESADYMMSSCTTMHPINKTDKVNLRGWEFTPISYLTEYDIIKKKYTIREFISFVYLQ